MPHHPLARTVMTALVATWLAAMSAPASPVVQFSTYLGGASGDYGFAAALDGTGALYLAGATSSNDFPTKNPIQATNRGFRNALIVKLDPTGTSVVYATYLGGSYIDQAYAIAVDSAGQVTIVGEANSTDFPVMNAIQGSNAGSSDAFVAKIDASGGSLLFSTYLGGEGADVANAVALDGASNVYVTGYTDSTLFPVANAIQPSLAGLQDAFVTAIAADGSALLHSTYLGGTDRQIGLAIATSASGEVSVAGGTSSTDFPTKNPIQPTNAGDVDAFLARIVAGGGSLVYATYYGGTGKDFANAAAIDGVGRLYFAGTTESVDLPTKTAFQGVSGGGKDAFVGGLNAAGSAVRFASYLGGGGDETGRAIGLDAAGNVHVAGDTGSTDFPTKDPFQATSAGGLDAFATRIDGALFGLAASTYVGGSASETAAGMAVDWGGIAFLTGFTGSPDFPTQDPIQPNLNGFADDVFAFAIGCHPIAIAPSPLPPAALGSPYSQLLTASNGASPYTFAVTGGALPPGLALQGGGLLSGTPATPGFYAFSVTATDSKTCASTQGYVLEVTGGVAPENIVGGEGLGLPNPNRVRVFREDGTATPVDFYAYAAGKWGVNVAGANVTGAPLEQMPTGPGPGDVFGPQVRVFRETGSPIAKINFYAYGTLKYGVNVGAGRIDGDVYDEILTGAGPGTVFGPHVRAFNYDNAVLTAIGKVSFFAYATLKYGVNVGSGFVDSDPFAEILTGPGPGAMFGPTVRGFNYDGAVLAAIAKINYNPFATPQYGVNVAGGDVDGDGYAEILSAPGPGSGPSFPPRFRGHNYDGATIAPLPGFDVTVSATTAYGGRVGSGDINGDGSDELLAGQGRDPAADATVFPFVYVSPTLTPALSFDPFVGETYGVNATGGALGF